MDMREAQVQRYERDLAGSAIASGEKKCAIGKSSATMSLVLCAFAAPDPRDAKSTSRMSDSSSPPPLSFLLLPATESRIKKVFSASATLAAASLKILFKPSL